MRSYNFGGVGFGFDTAEEIKESSLYGQFLVDEKDFSLLPEKHIFYVDNNLLFDDKQLVFKTEETETFKVKDGYVKETSRFDEESFKYICFQSPNAPGGKVMCTASAEKKKTSAELFRIIDLVSALLFYDAFILHASCVMLDGKAYIFSGNSGVGKTTQAELWQKYAGAKVMNGDRVLIRKTDNEWFACGLPMCGSSSYCENYVLPIEMICFLNHGKSNEIKSLSGIERFMLLSSQISCGARKPEDSQKLLSLTEELIKSVRIFGYDCTKDEGAVRYLIRYLDNDGFNKTDV